MPRYLALLRGVNVGDRTKIAMADLRKLFAALGHDDVLTYIQSGNVIFTTSAGTESELAHEIEKRIAGDLGVRTTVLLRTGAELAKIVGSNPFTAREKDPTKLHVTFLADEPDRKRAAGFKVPANQPDRFELVGREVFLHCPNGYGRTKLNNSYVEKQLGVAATTRNWKVVNKLHELLNT